MSQLVRLWRGDWKKQPNGDWIFFEDPSDFGFGALIGEGETFESLMTIVRMRYQLANTTPVVLSYQLPDHMLVQAGRRSPPITLSTTADVGVMLTVRDWYAEQTVNVTIGPQNVAMYHFHRRDNFVVRGRTFVVDGSSNEEGRNAFEGLMNERIIVCSVSVLEEIFSEEDMVILHRVALELNSPSYTRGRRAPPPSPTTNGGSTRMELVLLDDDDEVMATTQVSNGGHSGLIVANSGEMTIVPVTEQQLELPLSQPPTAFGDVGLDLMVTSQNGNPEIDCEGFHDNFMWERLLEEGLLQTVQGLLQTVHVGKTLGRRITAQPNEPNEPNQESPKSVLRVLNGPEAHDGGNSSTGSSVGVTSLVPETVLTPVTGTTCGSISSVGTQPVGLMSSGNALLAEFDKYIEARSTMAMLSPVGPGLPASAASASFASGSKSVGSPTLKLTLGRPNQAGPPKKDRAPEDSSPEDSGSGGSF
ncbi:Uncharacterized protein Rs2_37004 [Raphanus sativus]|uniref:Uncharacterized protein LOC130498814 n=1 Tax=Raphanus sativus TaxID=3726 RepID=A0A9W3CAD2_RAPSA|nr:uncharacterized protein LOC130498814 [Raphanus sativus]KAJ4879950.1 Uncharacterized protein Rs2_37004 [Raphanus sativus]